MEDAARESTKEALDASKDFGSALVAAAGHLAKDVLLSKQTAETVAVVRQAAQEVGGTSVRLATDVLSTNGTMVAVAAQAASVVQRARRALSLIHI